ncbi:MAG: FKBP-type peptidyl-prolyl cis-trans isomerase [Actinomycetales bacterium]|nr:FKBP-type peptidyl-prolyl cis-trans isomerase [Actinomycetales bacterium]
MTVRSMNRSLPMSPRPFGGLRLLAAAGLAGATLIAGCGGGSPAGDAAAPAGYPGVTVTGEAGTAPVVTVEGAEPPVELASADLIVGDGRAVSAGDTLTVHYTGVGLNSGAVFDSSWSRGEPVTFGLDQLIEGWQVGLPGATVGTRRLLVVPADMAYGETPPLGSGIAPGEPLIFVIDVVAIG